MTTETRNQADQSRNPRAARPHVRGRLRHRHRVRHRCRRAWTRTSSAPSRRKKDEPEWMTRMAPGGLPPLADDADAALGEARHRADRLPGDQLLLRAEGPKYASLDEVAAGTAGHLREARRAAARAREARRRRGRRGVRLGLGRHHLPQGTGREGRDLLLDVRSGPRISGTGAGSTSAASCRPATTISPR